MRQGVAVLQSPNCPPIGVCAAKSNGGADSSTPEHHVDPRPQLDRFSAVWGEYPPFKNCLCPKPCQPSSPNPALCKRLKSTKSTRKLEKTIRAIRERAQNLIPGLWLGYRHWLHHRVGRVCPSRGSGFSGTLNSSSGDLLNEPCS